MKKNDIGNKAENLKNILKGFGINSPEELDKALSETLNSFNVGIMTETIAVPANSA